MIIKFMLDTEKGSLQAWNFRTMNINYLFVELAFCKFTRQTNISCAFRVHLDFKVDRIIAETSDQCARKLLALPNANIGSASRAVTSSTEENRLELYLRSYSHNWQIIPIGSLFRALKRALAGRRCFRSIFVFRCRWIDRWWCSFDEQNGGELLVRCRNLQRLHARMIFFFYYLNSSIWFDGSTNSGRTNRTVFYYLYYLFSNIHK